MDANDTWKFFVAVILVQLFYSFAITLLAYALPASAIHYVTGFSELSGGDLGSVGSSVQASLDRQTNIPVIEIGALVFYSGNILLDLLLNFAFAIPQMLGMLVNGIMLLLNVDSYIFAVVQLFASVVVTVMYFIGLMNLLVSIRSGRVV